jgi:hypothetical protein
VRLDELQSPVYLRQPPNFCSAAKRRDVPIAVVLDLESTCEILTRLGSAVDVQAECNPARIEKLRFFLERMKACGLHVSKTAL